MPTEQTHQDAVDNAKLELLIRENTSATMGIKEEVLGIKRVLIGEPEYKRPGIVETVDFHRKIIIMGSAVIFFLYPAWEFFKWWKPHP